MTEAQLGELMRAQALREGHRGRLPEASASTGWQSDAATRRREALEEAILGALRAADRALIMQEIVRAVDPDKTDAIQNAVRRLKTAGLVRTSLEGRNGKNAVLWRLT